MIVLDYFNNTTCNNRELHDDLLFSLWKRVGTFRSSVRIYKLATQPLVFIAKLPHVRCFISYAIVAFL